jgi:very-short-patch-repair endonuclease
MGDQIDQSMNARAWALAARQHDVIALWQLLAIGFTRKAVKHRVSRGRLHPIFRGVYAVGSPNTTRFGYLLAAVLACGEGAALSHESAGEVFGVRNRVGGPVHVVVPGAKRRHNGVAVHRRTEVRKVQRHGIPVTTITDTLIDLATILSRDHLEAAVNEADKLDLITPARLRTELEHTRLRPGVRRLRRLIDIHTFVATRSWLERRLPPIARRAGIADLQSQALVNGERVDFYSPSLRIVIETDGGRFHRTPLQQTKDRRRDQLHLASGLIPLRFTHGQIRYEPQHVEGVLRQVANAAGSSRAA